MALLSFDEYLNDIPLLHTWDNGKTWNTGGFNEHFLRPFRDMAASFEKPTIVETGAGNSTIAFLFAKPEKLITIAPDRELIDRITAYCRKCPIDMSSFVPHLERSEIQLPKLLEQNIRADMVFLDGGHGWPTVFVDFCYMNAMLKKDGILIIDDVQLHSIGELKNLLVKQPGFEVLQDLGKSIAFRKLFVDPFLPDWGGQPYIVEMLREKKFERPHEEKSGLLHRIFSCLRRERS